ncbi:hypothetical protein BDR22DRAFT_618707 [Usnea florida]
MCPTCGNGGPYHNPNYSNYQYPPSTQTLRPPTVNTGYPSNGYNMNRTSSHGSSDSGYGTRTPSVASPTPQPSYSNQSYLVQNSPLQSYSTLGYPSQSYFSNGQPSQQTPTSPYSDARSPSIEIVRTAPVSSSKHKKERRISPTSPSSPSQYPCLHPHCGHTSSRAHDLKRHMTIHFPPDKTELLDCKYEWCGRTGAHGFKREDHRKEHYRKVHMKESEYPKTGKGGRSGKRSRS